MSHLKQSCSKKFLGISVVDHSCEIIAFLLTDIITILKRRLHHTFEKFGQLQ